jgi:hypothetical protein
MDKKIAALLGAAAALTTVTAAHAAAPATEMTQATSYRDLLDPVPNAVAALKADDARLAEKPASGGVQTAQYHDHHHHHHVVPRIVRRVLHPRHHHHHHHHHH